MKQHARDAFFLALLGAILPRVLLAAAPAAQADPAKDLARQLEAAVTAGDSAKTASLLDMDRLIDRTTSGVAAPEDFRTGFRDGMKKAQSPAGAIAKAAQGGTYKVLRVRQVNSERRVLCRMVLENGGLNYHDWVVGKDAQGKPTFVDIYVGITGELMSQTMRRLYVAASVQANPTWIERLTGSDKSYAANIDKIDQFNRDMQGGNSDAALADYKALPQDMRQNKYFLIMRLVAASRVQEQSPQGYQAAAADLQKLFPGDPSLDLVCLDGLVTDHKYAEARKGVDRLEKFTGGDAYLQFLRGNLYLMEGGDANFAAAKKSFRQSIATEPTLQQPYWGLVTLSLKTRNFDETAATLNEIERKLPLKIGDLQNVPDYAEFVKSPAYQKWKAARAGQG